MSKKSFYIVLFCIAVAGIGFTFATQLRTQNIYEQACPDGNCETIIKEYEYLPIEDDHAADQAPVKSEGAEVVEKSTGIADDSAETDENTIYNRNVFIAGNDVTAKQIDVNGVLFAAGRKVRATGSQQSIAAAGETVVLDSVTHQEAYLAGLNVNLTENASVRDLYAAGETVTVSGIVRGDAYLAGESIIFENATILGDANLASANVEFMGDNMIHGTLRYDSDTRVANLDKSKVGGIASYAIPDINKDVTYVALSYAAKVCTMIAGIAIFVVFLAKISKTQYQRFIENKSAVKDAGIGFIALIVIPSIMLAFLAFDFLALINIVLILTLAIVLISSVGVAAGRLGKFVNSKILKSKDTGVYQIALLGAVTFSLIWIIPVFGPAFDFVLLIAGFGYILGEMIHNSVLRNKQKSALKTKE